VLVVCVIVYKCSCLFNRLVNICIHVCMHIYVCMYIFICIQGCEVIIKFIEFVFCYFVV